MCENKRCIKRCILFNSAGFLYAEVAMDGHIDIAGGTGTGKSTLLNAFFFPLLVDNELLNIGSEKEEFAKYYFKHDNSFIFYEIVNKKGAEYCAVLRKTRQGVLLFHIVDSPFNESWLYNDSDGLEPVRFWDELASNIGSALVPGSYKRESFNRLLLGVDSDYSESYSLMSFDGKKVDGAKATFGIRQLLSIILRNRELSQSSLKETLVSAVIAENQSKTDGINLAAHRKNLGDFISRKHDIELATERNKDGVTVLEMDAASIFEKVDDYARALDSIRATSGLLAFAMEKSSKRADEFKSQYDKLNTDYASTEERFEAELNSLNQEIETKLTERGIAQGKVDQLKEVESKYKDCDNIQDVVYYSSRRKSLEEQKNQYNTALLELNKDADDIRAREKIEIDRIKNILQDKLNQFNNAAVKEKSELSQKILSIHDAYDEDCRTIRDNYKEDLNAAGSSEADTLEIVLRSVRETESELTIEELREHLVENGLLTESVGVIVASVAAHHSPSCLTGAELIKHEKKIISDYKAKRAQIDILNRQMDEEIEAAGRKRDRALKTIEEEKISVEERRKANYKKLVREANDKEAEIHKTYEILLSGNDAAISDAVTELKDKLDSVEYILDQVNTYPAAGEDYEQWISKAMSIREECTRLNEELKSLHEKQSKLKSEKKTALDAIDADRLKTKADYDKANVETQNGQQFITNHLVIRESIEAGAKEKTGKSVTDIIGDYYVADGRINELERDIPRSVRHLFAPGMLTPVDTFNLGYGKTSNLEECLVIADNLRVLLQETSTGEKPLETLIKSNASIWIHELQAIASEMGIIEANMSLLIEHCRKANRFMDAHNTTDCCADIKLEIEEKSNTDLMGLLREINEFWHTRGHLVGYDNLFAVSDEESANVDAVNLLKGFSEALEKTPSNEISLSEMFDVKMSFREKGNYHHNLMKFDNPASGSTNVILKSIINMTLLKILIDANRSNKDVILPIPVDEMNDISITNLEAFITYANAAGMHLVFCGQHHTIPSVKYSYNTWDEQVTESDGFVRQDKFIALQTVELFQ